MAYAEARLDGYKPGGALVSYLRPKTGVASSEASLSEAAATVRPGQKGRSQKFHAGIGERKYLGYIDFALLR